MSTGETPRRGIGAFTDDPAPVNTTVNPPTVDDASVIALLKRLIILQATTGSSGGGLTDTELRATPVEVRAAPGVPIEVTGEGGVGSAVLVDFPTPIAVAGPLTDTQLRAAVVPVSERHATNTITVTGGANAIATATLPAAGANLFHYITHIWIARVATAALAGGALLTVTTTNLNGRAWRTGNQMSITVSPGHTALLTDQEFAHPLKSAVANTNTTIVGPAAGAAVSWHMVIDYFTGP